MPNYVTYPELTDLRSSKVKVFNNYHGQYSTRDCNPNDVVVYTCFGEACNLLELSTVQQQFKDQFLIIVTTRKYLDIPHSGPGYKIFTIPSAYAFYSTKIPNEKIAIDNKVFEKTFVSLNYRASWNRQALAQFVISHQLLDKMYFSYHCGDRFGEGHKKIYDRTNAIIGSDATWFNHNVNHKMLWDMIPIVSGLEDLYKFNDWSFGHKDYYEKSFCSIINETYIDENFDPFFTEKIFKPLAYTHPFMVYSSAGALELLRQLGFETFNEIFDESYDKIENPQLRLETIFREMLRIANLDSNELQAMYSKIIPVLKHNHNVFWNELPSKYKKDIQIVKEEIQSIIEATQGASYANV